MSAGRSILAVLAIAVAALAVIVAASVLTSPYHRFLHRDQSYYGHLAKACESLLEAHPPGSNTSLEISTSEQSLPAIISELRPSKITLSSNHVWFMAGARDFGVCWEPQGGTNANNWTLSCSAEGPSHELYVAAKPLPKN